MDRSSLRLATVLLVVSAAGCGGGTNDPFPDRSSVQGMLTVDDAPAQWASLTLTGQKNETTQEQAMVRLAVRDGKFATEAGAPGTTPGENSADVIIYAEEPKEEVDRPKVTGYWRGSVSVTEGQPLEIKLKSSDLSPTPL